MGHKYPSHLRLTDAQKKMIRDVERNPFYKPKSARTRTRFERLQEKKILIVNKNGRVKVELPE